MDARPIPVVTDEGMETTAETGTRRDV